MVFALVFVSTAHLDPPTIMSGTAELVRVEEFSAAHRLHSRILSDEENALLYDKCNHPDGHGHNYRWEVTLRGQIDERTGMLYDMATLKKEMNSVLELVDHKNLDKNVAFFADRVSTTENLCVFLWRELKSRMSRPELLHLVRVHETSKNSFTYKE